MLNIVLRRIEPRKFSGLFVTETTRLSNFTSDNAAGNDTWICEAFSARDRVQEFSLTFEGGEQLMDVEFQPFRFENVTQIFLLLFLSPKAKVMTF